MSISTVVTRGYGLFGSIADLVRRGYQAAVGVSPLASVSVSITAGGLAVTITQE